MRMPGPGGGGALLRVRLFEHFTAWGRPASLQFERSRGMRRSFEGVLVDSTDPAAKTLSGRPAS